MLFVAGVLSRRFHHLENVFMTLRPRAAKDCVRVSAIALSCGEVEIYALKEPPTGEYNRLNTVFASTPTKRRFRRWPLSKSQPHCAK